MVIIHSLLTNFNASKIFKPTGVVEKLALVKAQPQFKFNP